MKRFIGFLILAVFLTWFVISLAVADSVNVKLGAMDYMVEGMGIAPRLEVGYEFNRTFEPELWVPILSTLSNGEKLKVPFNLGLELGIGISTVVPHDTQVETPYVGKGMGRLNTLDYYITLKWYLPYNLHIGGGVNYLDPYFREYYSAQADWDDEVGAHAQVGWEFTKDWTAILKFGWGDIDVESGKDPEWAYGYKFTNGILEAQSNQDYYAFMIERKF